MGKNIIFVFSGTGNSLWVAKEISSKLDNCDIISMGSHAEYLLTDDYDSIGFVYPTYYRGAPGKVLDFAKGLDFQKWGDAYLYAVATCGSVDTACNATSQLSHMLKKKGVTLHYAEKLDMYSNYVVFYEMRETIKEETAQSANDLKPIIMNIMDKVVLDSASKIKLVEQIVYKAFIHSTPHLDKHFNISDRCTGCGICSKVCPVNNIDLSHDRKPVFKHHCEQCLACVHNCPTKAVNYKNKTQNRSRYIHPQIHWKDLAALNNQ